MEMEYEKWKMEISIEMDIDMDKDKDMIWMDELLRLKCFVFEVVCVLGWCLVRCPVREVLFRSVDASSFVNDALEAIVVIGFRWFL